MERRLDLRVTADMAGRRVDTLLRQHLGLSGTVIRRIKWLETGILLDGERVHTDVRVSPGQILTALIDDPGRRSGIPSTPGALDIVYEDADVVVVNKPAGLLVHPIPSCPDRTLGNFLLHHYDEKGQTNTDFHPVHRLDKGTTGLLVAAKHPHAQTILKNQLHTPDFRRVYLALVTGVPDPPEGVVDAPIGSLPGSPIAHRVDPQGLPARTRYRTEGDPVSRNGQTFSLVRMELETGRTHQIRVHMAHLGHPLAGDFLYGVEDRDLIPRPALHSAQLTFRHPLSGDILTFTQPLPDDMKALI